MCKDECELSFSLFIFFALFFLFSQLDKKALKQPYITSYLLKRKPVGVLQLHNAAHLVIPSI